MVKLVSCGQLGNQMFQYAFARTIAEELGYSLVTENNEVEKIFNLPPLSGKLFLEPEEFIDEKRNELDLLDKLVANKTDRLIHLKGYFEKYLYYKPNKEKIKKWYYLDPIDKNNNIIGIHLRMHYFSHLIKPLEYYYDILKKEQFDKIAIATDDVNHNYVKTILKDFSNAFVLSLDRIDTMRYFKTLEKIIIGHGTYGWWLGFLSNASRIYMPNHIDSQLLTDVDLRVTDEERYIFV